MPNGPLLRLAASILCLTAGMSAAAAQGQAIAVDTPGGSVSAIRMSGGRAHVRAGGRWYGVESCQSGFCLSPRRPVGQRRAPTANLPGAGVATASGGGIRSAWYAGPSDRYRHGILGDATEPTLLVVTAAGGRRYEIAAPDDGVFEDLTPRIADLDGDGTNEVVAIASSAGKGASLAVYGVAGGALALRAATPAIGRSNRWRNPSTIADLTGDRVPEIAEVVTPHIGGTLRIWSFRGGRLRQVASASGFSNHVIGSRELALSAVADADGDGRADIAVPTADRRALAVMALKGSRLVRLLRVAVPGRIDKAVAVVATAEGPAFLVGLDDGRLLAVTR